jgi:hypothetical protein
MELNKVISDFNDMQLYIDGNPVKPATEFKPILNEEVLQCFEFTREMRGVIPLICDNKTERWLRVKMQEAEMDHRLRRIHRYGYSL